MGRNRVGVFVHVVWGTWDREPLLTAALEEAVHRIIAQEAVRAGCDVVAIGGVEDHVHVLLGLPTTITIADLVRQMKGASARWAADARGGAGCFKWQGSYGISSVSSSHVPVVAHYVHDQKHHHAQGSLIVRLEFDPPTSVPSALAPAKAGARWRAAPPSATASAVDPTR